MQSSTKFNDKNASYIQWALANLMLRDKEEEILLVSLCYRNLFTFTHGEVAVCLIQALLRQAFTYMYLQLQ